MRFLEIDVARGVAVITMVLFHVGFDLRFLEILPIPIWNTTWQGIAFFTQLVFILTTGMTFFLASTRGKTPWPHALKLFAWGMLITVITWFLFEDQAVWFGILHFYGVAILLGMLFRRFGVFNLAIGLGWLGFTQIVVDHLSTQALWGVPLGFYGGQFASLDYFPLFPWFGWFLIGIGFAAWFYHHGRRRWTLPAPHWICKLQTPFAWLGRHSLGIYLLHQPLIVGALWLLFK